MLGYFPAPDEAMLISGGSEWPQRRPVPGW